MNRVSRAQWGGKPPRSVTSLTPAYGTTVHYEGPHLGEFPHASCATKVRGIQKFHMDTRGWVDIAYTAIICPHGYIYEGRWVGVRTAANGTNDGNSSAYAVCLLAGEGDPITDPMLAALVDCIDYLDLHGGAGPSINGHRDWKPTQCPGGEAYRELPAIRAVIAKRRTTTPTPPEDDMPWTDEDRADQKAIRKALESINHHIAGDADAGARLPRLLRFVEAIKNKVTV